MLCNSFISFTREVPIVRIEKMNTMSPAERDLLNAPLHNTKTIQNDPDDDYLRFLAIPVFLLVFVLLVIVAWCIKIPRKQNNQGELSEVTDIQVMDGGSRSMPGVPVFKISKEENVIADNAFKQWGM